ncbi:myomegalin-like isoform X2 [Notamacropus eugenii]
MECVIIEFYWFRRQRLHFQMLGQALSVNAEDYGCLSGADSLSSPLVLNIGMDVPSSGYSTATSSPLDLGSSPFQRTKELGFNGSHGKETDSIMEGDAPDGSFANKHGHHMIGRMDDFSALKLQILEGKVLGHKTVSLVQVTLNSPALQGTE